MWKYFSFGLAIILMTGCSNPKNAKLPQNLSEMTEIQDDVKKLNEEDRQFLAGYVTRKTIGEAFAEAFSGKKAKGIPDNITVGEAIEDQKNFIAQQKIEEEKQLEIQKKILADQEAAEALMKKAVGVFLVSKHIEVEKGYANMILDEQLSITFEYRNNTTKEISGVKGYVSIQDLFGEEISGFSISNDITIPPQSNMRWTGNRSVKYSFGDNQDRKFAELPPTKFKVIWQPQMIVFSDGSKIEPPKTQ